MINGIGLLQNGYAKNATATAILHRRIPNEPPKCVASSGNYLGLVDGRQILDATGGAAVAAIGHGNARVKAAMMRQMDEVSYVHTSFFTTTASEELGRMLIDSTKGQMARAVIYSSGSEAMEASMKLARQYFLELSQPDRTKFIARKESYHGTTIGALSMGGHLARRKFFEPLLLGNITHVSACNEYRGPMEGESVREYVARLARELDDEFERLGPETVCAFVAEPVSGAALGCVPAVPGYFQAMKAVCDKHGALLIVDEVMCGMGRTGTMHAWEQEGIVPDIQTIGKGLGGGYQPVAGILIGHKVITAITNGTGAFAHGQTYQGHPVACAAAVEVLRIIQEHSLVDNVRRMGALLGRMLKQRLSTHDHVGDIRGKGLFWGIEFVLDKATKQPFPPAMHIANGITDKGLAAPYNISLYYGTGTVDGRCGDHILLAPPYNVTETDVKIIVNLTVRVIEDFFADDIQIDF
ncbi:aminotransferase [Delitschia confertaspora ATCC 74209]|uniref:Aminotransferase n=1 Tax=Delitschia confertaspora ATCC 74209 TaxID=1513339 RepID=A0A9P4MZ44_9PLEO|nr:aminotransferase [Delitschia confertaspora ATCC 74209]